MKNILLTGANSGHNYYQHDAKMKLKYFNFIYCSNEIKTNFK